MIGYVYKTTNLITGTIYIGKRQKPTFEKAHKGSGTILKQAFLKYGKENFSTVIIERCDTVEELCHAEKKHIREYREAGADMYNIAEGGEGGVLVKWWEFPEDKRNDIIEKNRNAHLGDKNPMYGKRMSDDEKELRRIRNRGRRLSQEAASHIRDGKRRHLREIVQIDMKSGDVIRVWRNWCEAGEQFKEEHGRCAYSHISECCQGKKKSAFGYRWAYREEAV